VSTPVTIDGATVQLSPVAVDALHGLLADHRAKRDTHPTTVHPACRARLLALGLVAEVTTWRNRPGLHLTPLGVTVATQIEEQAA